MFSKSVLLLLFYSYIGGAQGFVRLQSSGPTVRGANVTLSAIMTASTPYGEKKFIFRNVQNLEILAVIFSSESVVNYTVELSKDKYERGFYTFRVEAYMRKNGTNLLPYDSDWCQVMVTDLLNGNLRLIQNGIDKSYSPVFFNVPVTHNIKLSQEERQFLTNDKNTYLVYWYINCSLITTTGLSFDYMYEDAYKTYNLEVLVEVKHDPSFPANSTTRHDKLSSFKCAPIYSSGYTYGYYSASIRARATNSTSPPPSSTSENPSNTWQDSSSPDSTIGHWTPRTSESQTWRTIQRSPLGHSVYPPSISSSSEYGPVQTSEPWRNWRTTEHNSWRTWTSPKPRPSSTTSTPTQNTSNTGVQSNCTGNAHNTQISENNGHLKIAMDVVFHGTFNISSL